MIMFLPEDFRQKAAWVYGKVSAKTILKAILTDGSLTMVSYRIHQSFSSIGLGFVGAFFLKINSVISQSVIGRGVSFGPGFVVLHSTGLVINSRVKGGRNVFIEHGVTIGEEKGGVPRLGSDIFIGAGAKIFGAIEIGDRVRIGANAVVLHDVPTDHTAVGVPAKNLPRKPEGSGP